MIIGKTLSNPTPIFSPYLYPDGVTITPLMDVTMGGIGLSDPSAGLEYQVWTLTISPTGDFSVSSPATGSIYLFTRVNPTWGRLAFDQNMFPFISFIDINGPGYYWYDPAIHTTAFVYLPSTVTSPCCTMDDKRSQATTTGNNDIILAYIKTNNLYYRQQRDRYSTEYLLLGNVNNFIASPTLWKIGMNEGYRLQFNIHGSLYQ